jgi:hypothetical protein
VADNTAAAIVKQWRTRTVDDMISVLVLVLPVMVDCRCGQDGNDADGLDRLCLPQEIDAFGYVREEVQLVVHHLAQRTCSGEM